MFCYDPKVQLSKADHSREPFSVKQQSFFSGPKVQPSEPLPAEEL